MRRLYATQICFSFFLSIIVNTKAYAFGEILIDKLLRSDFIYDRGITNLPFIPLGYLAATHQSALEPEQCPLSQPQCEFQYQSITQGAGMPVWVGQKQMLILGETLDVDVFDAGNDSTTINTGGLLAAWVSQHSVRWQSGAFIYHYQNLDSDARSDNTRGTFVGMVGRYRHGAHFHSYWGAVQVNSGDESLLYPYAGFDWYINKHWGITAVLPWPSVNYAPSESQLFRIGALVSETTWTEQQDNNFYTQDFSQLSLGISFEQKFSRLIWGELSAGYTGLGKLQIEADADSKLTTDISNEPFVKLALNLRPF
ncbi:MAG: hypothetical protein K0Q67_2908 [Cellvibrio sp.]|jgi:hypothetical protein|nr:hypothetical protein [Cellvibrio sp.]